MLVREGKVSVEVGDGKINRKLEGFYNPEMKLNRDIAVWLVGKLKPKKILDANAASGIRAKRFLIEANAKEIVATDINSKLLNKNLKDTLIEVVEKDANEVMNERKFDFIDIDPFGSPSGFIEKAVYSLNKNGVLALTATDIGCLSGRFVKACIRKYDSRPMPCMFANELGIRILIQKAITVAKEQGKNLKPIFCHAGKHYYRVYLKNTKAAENLGFILLCRKCLNFYQSKNNDGVCCNKKMDYAGPLWLGSLFDKELVSDFDLIPVLKTELNTVGYYETHYLAKKFSLPKVMKIDSCLSKLAKLNFKASKTHFSPNGIKTNAKINQFKEILS